MKELAFCILGSAIIVFVILDLSFDVSELIKMDLKRRRKKPRRRKR